AWEPVGLGPGRAGAGQVFLVGAEAPAVLHAGGAGRLAGPALQAQVEVFAPLGGQLGAAVGARPPQVDAAAGAVVLVAGLDVGRAGGQAQTAVDGGAERLVGGGPAHAGGGEAPARGSGS